MKNLWTIFRRELASYFNSAIAYIFVIVFVVFSSGIFMMQFFEIGLAEMRQFFSMMPYTLNIFIPALSMRLWSEDKRGNTYELLLTFPMKPHQLVLGKFLASLTFYIFTLASTFTIPLMLHSLGHLDMGSVVGGYLGAFFLGALFLALGIFISGFCKDQIVAFILGVLVTFGIYFAGTDMTATFLDGWLPGLGTFVKNNFGVASRISGFSKGIIDLKDIAYFVISIGVFLFLNGLSLEGRYRPKAKIVFTTAVFILLTSSVLTQWLIHDMALGRFDVTEGKIYTVSESSIKILKQLKVPLQAKLYISPSENMPTTLKTMERELLDKLEELKVASQGKFVYKVIHLEAVPDEKDPMRQTLQAQGVVPFQVESVQKDEVGVKLIYSTLTLEYKEKPAEIIPRIVPSMIQDIEYQLLSRAYKLMLDEKPLIAVFAPAKEEEISSEVASALGQENQAKKNYSDEFKTTSTLLRNNGYTVERIGLTKEDSIPDKTTILLLMNPGALNDRQRFEINRYLRQGGTVVAAAQGFEYSFTRQPTGVEAMPKKLDLGINALIEKWGIKVNEDILLDENSEMISVSSGQRIGPFALEMPVKLPNQIVVEEDTINHSAPITGRIPSIAYLWGSALDLTQDTIKQQNLKVTTLFTSSAKSWTLPFNGSNLTSENTSQRPAESKGLFPLAVLVEGSFSNASGSDKAPAWPAAEGKEAGAPEEVKVDSPKPGRLLLIGCSQIFGETLIQSPGNINLFANIVDGYSLGEDLVNIRSKTSIPREIKHVSSAEKLWYKFFTVGLVPLCLFAASLIRIFLRKKEKEFYLAALNVNR